MWPYSLKVPDEPGPHGVRGPGSLPEREVGPCKAHTVASSDPGALILESISTLTAGMPRWRDADRHAGRVAVRSVDWAERGF